MKYRVKFQCYWYNTGAADNHHYMSSCDFDTLEEAQEFKKRVDHQFSFHYQGWSEEQDKWYESDQAIEVENGFISGTGTIYEYYPEIENKI